MAVTVLATISFTLSAIAILSCSIFIPKIYQQANQLGNEVTTDMDEFKVVIFL